MVMLNSLTKYYYNLYTEVGFKGLDRFIPDVILNKTLSGSRMENIRFYNFVYY